jgi:hypothetical protein
MKKVKTLKQLSEHEAVRELFSECNDEDRGLDYWVNLNDGWVCSEDGNSSMHCWGAESIIKWFNTYIMTKEDYNN